MKRSLLAIGTEVGIKIKYIIDAVIGLGANCIVYDAHYLDSLGNKKPVKLKECYPVVANITRNESVLFWEEDSDKESAFDRFDKSYRIAGLIQNSDMACDTSVYSLDLIEFNNTMYIAMIPKNGISYDKVNSDNIIDIIRTVLALANAVGRYHQIGYLHLDVKPGNFIATEDHTGNGINITLFDFDTIVPFDSITGRTIKSVSYSKGWTAPEQIQQQIGKLCPATDIFSIGAILFERVMKRRVENCDMSPLAKWEFDNRFDVKHVNPKVKRLFVDIFHKTLASNVKKRYQTSHELSVAMNELLDVVINEKPYIISSFPVSTCHFIGRSDELDELHNAVAECKKVFVSGCGGIGKSELVKRYINLYKHSYDAVVFLRYTGSIAETLRNIKIKGVSDSNDMLKTIEELCDDRTLLVIDNFDMLPDEDIYLEYILSIGSKIIITTRTDFSGLYANIHCIKISGMTQSELRTIFETESSMKLNNEEFIDLMSIIHMGEQCTHYWVLLAKLLKSGDYSLKELCIKVSAGLSEFDDTEDILNTKDGIRIKQTVAKALSELFKLTKLTPNESEILILLYHLDCLSLSKKQIKEIVSVDKTFPVRKRINVLNELIERGFVDHNLWGTTDELTISDVIKDTIYYDLTPSIIDSSIVKMFIEQELFDPKTFIISIKDNDDIERDRIEYKFRCLFKIIKHSNIANNRTKEYYIELLYRMLGGEESVAYYIWNEYTYYVLRFLNVYSLDKKADSVSRVKADIILLTVFCYQTRGIPPLEDIHIKSIKNAEKAFFHGLKIIEQNSQENSHIIDDMCRPFVCCALKSTAHCRLIEPKLIEKILELRPECIDLNVLPFESFDVRVFINSDYEKLFLYQVKRRAEEIEDNAREEFLYRKLGKIMLNGMNVPCIIDQELRSLREELFSTCLDKFENMEKIDPLDFAPDPIGLPKNLTIGMGLERFKASISADESDIVNLYQEQPEWNLGLIGGEFDEVDLSNFSEAIQRINSAEKLYSAILEFRYLVNSISGKELSEADKRLFLQLTEMLSDKLNESELIDDFPFIDELATIVSLEDAKAMLYSINAVLYCLMNDVIKARTCIEKVFEHSVELLTDMSVYSIINFEDYEESDFCFWNLIDRLNDLSYNNITLQYILDYTSMVKKRLDICRGYVDSWMYKYYKKIVSVAEKAKEALMPSSAEERLIWAIFKDDDSEESRDIDSLCKIIEEYTLKIEKISGLKYHP